MEQDSRNRVKIQLYCLDWHSDEEWQKVETTKYYLQGVLQDDIWELYTKKLDIGLVIHKDFINLIHQWSQSHILERKGTSSTQPFTRLPSEAAMLNSHVNIIDEAATDVWINRWVKDDTLKAQL